MKTNTIKDIVLLGTFAGFAYYISRYYRQKKQKRKNCVRHLIFSCSDPTTSFGR